jgi:hypothetical protein
MDEEEFLEEPEEDLNQDVVDLESGEDELFEDGFGEDGNYGDDADY